MVRFLAIPSYDRFMRRTLAALRSVAEERAERSRRYPGHRHQAEPT